MQIFVDTKYDFVKWRFHAVVFSLIWVIIGAVMFAKHGINWGIDFAGGANIVLKFKDAPPTERLRSLLTDAAIQQYGKAEDNAVLIRLPEQKKEGDYAGNTVNRLNQALNPEASSGKVDLNFRGRESVADLLYQADPDRKGTNADAKKYYDGVAQNIISKRSELGLFRNMQQVVNVPGVTTGIAGVLNGRTFLGSFNVLNQETVGPQVGRGLQQEAVWRRGHRLHRPRRLRFPRLPRHDQRRGLAEHRRRAAADRRLLDQRHGRDVRPRPREPAQDQDAHVVRGAAQPGHEPDAVANDPDLGLRRDRAHRPAPVRRQGHPRVRLDPPHRRPRRYVLDDHDRSGRGHRLEQVPRPRARHRRPRDPRARRDGAAAARSAAAAQAPSRLGATTRSNKIGRASCRERG